MRSSVISSGSGRTPLARLGKPVRAAVKRNLRINTSIQKIRRVKMAGTPYAKIAEIPRTKNNNVGSAIFINSKRR
jgi:hypothetical protein